MAGSMDRFKKKQVSRYVINKWIHGVHKNYTWFTM